MWVAAEADCQGTKETVILGAFHPEAASAMTATSSLWPAAGASCHNLLPINFKSPLCSSCMVFKLTSAGFQSCVTNEHRVPWVAIWYTPIQSEPPWIPKFPGNETHWFGLTSTLRTQPELDICYPVINCHFWFSLGKQRCLLGGSKQPFWGPQRLCTTLHSLCGTT